VGKIMKAMFDGNAMLKWGEESGKVRRVVTGIKVPVTRRHAVPMPMGRSLLVSSGSLWSARKNCDEKSWEICGGSLPEMMTVMA
jgi:hypothetical protein